MVHNNKLNAIVLAALIAVSGAHAGVTEMYNSVKTNACIAAAKASEFVKQYKKELALGAAAVATAGAAVYFVKNRTAKKPVVAPRNMKDEKFQAFVAKEINKKRSQKNRNYGGPNGRTLTGDIKEMVQKVAIVSKDTENVTLFPAGTFDGVKNTVSDVYTNVSTWFKGLSLNPVRNAINASTPEIK